MLELRGNPFPALKPNLNVNRNFIHNVLLEEARKEFRRKKYAQLSEESELIAEKTDAVDELTEQLEEIALKESDETKPSTDNPEQKK